MKTALLFDLDGTLLDTLQDLTDSVNHTLAQYNCPQRTLEQIRTFVGNGMKNLIIRALPGLENDPPVEDVLASYKAYYGEHCLDKTAPYAGVCEALAQLKDFPIAIVSNKADKDVKPLCAHFFPGIFARGEAADCPRKPAPDMLMRTMEQLGCQKCIYIGDSEVDVLTAQNAGVPCVSVTWGFRSTEELFAAGATHLCNDPKDLPDMLRQIEKEM